ncbi:MAG: CRTAC1 family protein [Bacteroidota bacterium]
MRITNNNKSGQRLWAILLFSLSSLMSCQSDSAQTAQMVDLLKATEQQLNVRANPYASTVLIGYFDSLMRVTAAPEERNKYRYNKAIQLLFAGKTAEAIPLFEQVKQALGKDTISKGMSQQEEFNQRLAMEKSNLPLGNYQNLSEIDNYLALSYLRLGEQQNCQLNHTSASCLFPIRKAGVHRLPAGSRKAVELYTNLLRKDSTDLTSRWLLNVAYMTLGEYPEQVPPRWLISPQKFESDFPLRPFPDIASQVGLAINGLSGGVVIDDFDRDGNLDVFLNSIGLKDQVRYFKSDGAGSFSDKTAATGLTGITGGLNMVQADYNNDGYVDIFILRGGWFEGFGTQPNSLLRNNGDGTFTDVTQQAGLLSFHPTQTATWNDFNRDGWVDLFIGNETTSESNFHPSELYLNNQDGTFTEVAEKAGVTINRRSFVFTAHYVKGVVSGDYNNDGWPDLYVSTVSGRRNFLFKNNGLNQSGQLTFTDVSKEAGLDQEIYTFPTWFWDYDNDGWLDIFVAGYKRSNRQVSIAQDVAAEYLGMPHSAQKAYLYHNNHDGTFTNVAKQVGLDKILYGMGANFGDLDNDGFLDLYMGTGEINLSSVIPNRMFRNNGGRKFQDVTTASGTGHLQKGHGISFADLDNDGDQDVYIVLGGALEGDIFQNSLFENPYQDENAWITLVLEGKESNRLGIGARAKLVVIDQGKRREIYRDLNSGGSFGCSPLRLQIGLGKATRIESLEITWPVSKPLQRFTNLPVRQFIRITEGSKKYETLHPTRLQFNQGAVHQHSH